jgi:dGTP triphosphohydrolase
MMAIRWTSRVLAASRTSDPTRESTRKGIRRSGRTCRRAGTPASASPALRHAAEPEHLLPPDRQEEEADLGSALRGCCDHVSSLTERQALLLYHRMSGVSPGSITDRLFS